MKKVLLITASVLLSLGMKAQITLDASTAPSVAICQTEDTFDNVEIGGTFPDVSAKTNATWDFTVVKDSNSVRNFNAPISSTVFPNANFTILGHYPFSGLFYFNHSMFSTSAAGIIRHGEHIDRQALSIAALTGNTKDSLVFIDQDVIYDNPENRLKYPITMSTSWTTVTKFTTKFELTVTGTMNKAPGERRSVRTLEHTVIGWGKLRVNDEAGNPSDYIDVLQIREEESTADSFYIGGAPAPPALLASFGLSQGQITVTPYVNFMRKGEQRELVQITYTDNTYTTMTKCAVHKQRLPKPAGIGNIKPRHISVFPNPATNNTLTVKLGVPYNELQYELISMTGQTVQQGTIPKNGIIQLNDQLPTGNYIIDIQTEKGVHGAKRVSIVK